MSNVVAASHVASKRSKVLKGFAAVVDGALGLLSTGPIKFGWVRVVYFSFHPTFSGNVGRQELNSKFNELVSQRIVFETYRFWQISLAVHSCPPERIFHA